ncbi:FeoA family protein [Tepidibacillus marianensis]|uniref:FeoA family protein n=1 Tax=Tepidibacillus marianensis TaxID=3131995 RepID=UPI0030CE9F55
MKVTLAQCRVGEKVRVKSLKMNEHKQKRLMDMGLLPGTTLEISRIAPFGDPLAVKLRGFQMSFRKQEAADIIVEFVK